MKMPAFVAATQKIKYAGQVDCFAWSAFLINWLCFEALLRWFAGPIRFRHRHLLENIHVIDLCVDANDYCSIKQQQIDKQHKMIGNEPLLPINLVLS